MKTLSDIFKSKLKEHKVTECKTKYINSLNYGDYETRYCVYCGESFREHRLSFQQYCPGCQHNHYGYEIIDSEEEI